MAKTIINNKKFVTEYTKGMSDQEFHIIREWIANKVQSPSMKMLIRLLMFTATPPIDAVKLKKAHFNKDYSEAYITRQKTKSFYKILIPSFIAQELKHYVDTYSDLMINEYLFFPTWNYNQSKNTHIQTSSIRAIFSKLRKDLDLNETYYTTTNGINLHRITPYTLRHFCAEQIYKATGFNLIAVKEYLNHKKIETTQEYLRGFTCTTEKKHQLIDDTFTIFASSPQEIEVTTV